ncbi:MAG: RNA polymerase sigma factor [Bryobacteraceae bacterium]
MEGILSSGGITAEQNRRVSDVIAREQSRLRQFIRSRVRSDSDAEDIFQEVFYELVDAYRLAQPLEQVGAWLFRVARNRITDLFRMRRSSSPKVADSQTASELEAPHWEELLPSPDAGPDALYVRKLLLEELDAALEELSEDQRQVFIAHEIEGRSFKDLSEETGVGLNTLLSRKRYAVLHLRRRLQSIYSEYGSS